MLDFYGWLRRKAKEAVLGGLADAVEEVAPGDGPADVDRLRQLVGSDAKALPARDDDEPATRRKK